MSLPKAIRTVLLAGTTNGITSQVYVGKSPRKNTGSSVEIDAINSAIDYTDVTDVLLTKDGAIEEIYSLSITIKSTVREDADDLVNAINVDIIAAIGTTVDTFPIRYAYFEGRGKWEYDKNRKAWTRSCLFRIYIDLLFTAITTSTLRLTLDAANIQAETSCRITIVRLPTDVMAADPPVTPTIVLSQYKWFMDGIGIAINDATGKTSEDLMDIAISGAEVAMVLASAQTNVPDYSGNAHLLRMELLSDVGDPTAVFEYRLAGTTNLTKGA